MDATITQVVFIIVTVFIALLALLLLVVLSRATVVRWVFGKIGRLLRRFLLRGRKITKISRRGTRGFHEAQGVVGTSGYAALKRLTQPKTFTERALDRSDKMSTIVDTVVKEIVDDYYPLQDQEDFDDYVGRFFEEVQTRWDQYKNDALEEHRRELFEESKGELIKKFGNKLPELLKEEYMPPADWLQAAGQAPQEEGAETTFENGAPEDEGATPNAEDQPPKEKEVSGENGAEQPWWTKTNKLTEEVLTFDMVDFDKVGFVEFTEHQEEAIVAQGSFEREKQELHRSGTLFSEITATPQYLPDHMEADARKSCENYLKATQVFRYDVTVNEDPDLLYEDINDAAIVDMIGNSDRKTLYFLTQWRKVVNRNVFVLSTLLSLILTTVLILNYIYGYAVVFGYDYENGTYDPTAKNFWIATELPGLRQWIEGMTGPLGTPFWNGVIIFLSKTVFAAVTIFIGYLMAMFLFRFPYTHFQRQNKKELVTFIRAKTARLSRDFYSAESLARGAFSGDVMRVGSREVAKIWFVNMHWVAWRVFSIELFLRSILYQVKRNSGYYVLGIPALFLVPLVFLIIGIFIWSLNQTEFSVMQTGVWILLNAPLIALFYWLAVTVTFNEYLAKCVLDLVDIDDSSWQNFHEFGLQRQTARLVRHYVGEIHNERMRVRGGGGVH